MAISVNVPKDWSGIKRKVIFNLTQRQLVSFAFGGIVGIPFYNVTKDILGPDISALGMVAVMLPFFFLAMYEKDGFPAEKIAYFIIRQKLLVPAIRPYRAENIFRQMEEVEMIRKEIAYLEEKEKKKKHTGSKGKETIK